MYSYALLSVQGLIAYFKANIVIFQAISVGHFERFLSMFPKDYIVVVVFQAFIST